MRQVIGPRFRIRSESKHRERRDPVATKKAKTTHGKRLKASKKIENKKPLRSVSEIVVTKPTDVSSP